LDICGVRYFLAVCETGSFTQAARVCGVSQPSVTSGVKRLERAVGADLLLRRRPIELTPLGAELRPSFEAMRAASDTVAAVIAEMRSRRNARGADRVRLDGAVWGPVARSAAATRVLPGPVAGGTCEEDGLPPRCRFPGQCQHQIAAGSILGTRRTSQRQSSRRDA
jgi:molybdenum-dependent DNA-binding transcriptional regulator ModE